MCLLLKLCGTPNENSALAKVELEARFSKWHGRRRMPRGRLGVAPCSRDEFATLRHFIWRTRCAFVSTGFAVLEPLGDAFMETNRDVAGVT